MDLDRNGALDRRQLLGEGLAGIVRLARALPSAGGAAAALGAAFVQERERPAAQSAPPASPAACFPAPAPAASAAQRAATRDLPDQPLTPLTPSHPAPPGTGPRDPQGGAQ